MHRDPDDHIFGGVIMTKKLETIKKIYAELWRLHYDAEESGQIERSNIFSARLDGIYIISIKLLTTRERDELVMFIRGLKS